MTRVDLLRLAAVLSLLPPEEQRSGPVYFEPPRESPRRELPPRPPGWWPVDSALPPKNLGPVVERVRAAQAKRARKAAKLEALAAKGAIRRRP
jgi:hypothetical protein